VSDFNSRSCRVVRSYSFWKFAPSLAARVKADFRIAATLITQRCRPPECGVRYQSIDECSILRIADVVRPADHVRCLGKGRRSLTSHRRNAAAGRRTDKQPSVLRIRFHSLAYFNALICKTAYALLQVNHGSRSSRAFAEEQCFGFFVPQIVQLD
jgi:hypothetical protein